MVMSRGYRLAMRTNVPAGQADLTGLVKLRELIVERADEVERAEEQHLRKDGRLTYRFVDEEQTAGHRGYYIAHGHLSGALEHFEVLWQVITGPHGITPRAPYSLMRPIFEHSFWALWVLDPEASITRRQRGLRVEVLDRRQRKTWAEVYQLSDDLRATMLEDHRSVMEIYEAEAEELRIAWKNVGNKPNLVDELPKLEAVARWTAEMEFEGAFVGTWRVLSGLNHGAIFALQVASDTQDEVKLERGAKLTVSVNDDWFMTTARVCLAMLLEALELMIKRTTRVVGASAKS